MSKTKPKTLLFRAGPLRKEVEVESESWTERYDTPTGWGQRRKWRITSAECECVIEVRGDIAKFVNENLTRLMQNKGKRLKRGPLEIRCVDFKEIEGTRKTVEKG